MDNNTLQIKIKQRLNKLSSSDYDNVYCWAIAEAFNKAQIAFVRNQIHGNNQHKEGDESSKVLIDDIQRLLTTQILTATQYTNYYLTQSLPVNYLNFKKISANAVTECCPKRMLVIYLANVADEDLLLIDPLRHPSAEWGETFATMSNNELKIFTGGEFELDDIVLSYYRKPVEVEFAGCVKMSDESLIVNDVECEFKDDVVELILDNAAALIAGDIESFNQFTRNKQESIKNN